MTYAARADMILTFGERELVQLTDRADPPAEMIDDTVLQNALDWAEGLINGYLKLRYALPLSGFHQILQGLAQDVAYWRLHREPVEEVRKRYEAAIKTLKDLSEGRLGLPDEAGLEPAGQDGTVLITSEERLFSRRKMRSW